MEINTTDLCDMYSDKLKVAEPIGFKDFGGKKSFFGQMHTIKCFENNPFIRRAMEENGEGKVLVIDGGGSLRCALMGDNMAELALKNKWSGIILYGCIRDSVAIAKLNIGLKALNTNPMKSFKRNDGEENVILHFAGIDFTPGAFVYCDEDGIVVCKEKLEP